MPAWVTIYCAQAVKKISKSEMMTEIRQNDFWTLAEQYDVDTDLVEPALAALAVQKRPDGIDLVYGSRPLAVRFWSKPDRVDEEIMEAQELVAEMSGNKEVSKHLETVKTVVGIEIGASQLEDMGIVLAYEMARWLANRFDGLIKTEDEEWLAVNDNAFAPI